LFPPYCFLPASIGMATQVAKKTVVSPGSPFPELLRRSRFASFDPTIRQSYGTPPSHLHRGNWGLKRPIAQRKRNAFISIKNFEEHEHYIKWNNAENQVRLIDKIEELNITPKLVPRSHWFIGLGPAATTSWSMIDSEFAPGESGMPPLPTSQSVLSFTPDLEGLGRRGRGEYGTNASTKTSIDGYLHPNFNAMPPRVFNRYLKKIRSLRPEFLKFLNENGITNFRETGVPPGNLHIRFLGQHFDKQFQDAQDKNADVHPNQTQPIRQQPHRLGALTYASPTYLESFFTSGPQPGIVLEGGSQSSNYSNAPKSFLVSTAGLIGKLEEKRAASNVKSAFTPAGTAMLLAGRTDDKTFIQVKVLDLHIERLPAAVTSFPSEDSSKEVVIRMELASHPPLNNHLRTNTHPPGSMLYNSQDDLQQPKGAFSSRLQKIQDIYPRHKIHKIGNKLFHEDLPNGETLRKLQNLNTPGRGPARQNSAKDGWSGRRKWDNDTWDEKPNPKKVWFVSYTSFSSKNSGLLAGLIQYMKDYNTSVDDLYFSNTSTFVPITINSMNKTSPR
jgi:hypothetical protein